MSDRDCWRRYVAVCVLIVALCIALKLPGLFFPRIEYDERIYWSVAWNWLHNGSYSLQGMPVLGELPAVMYDKPMFHHPPLLPILLMPFVAMNSPRLAILPSWLAHVLVVIGVAMVCWTWRRRSWRATHFLLWLPVLAVALDPLMTFCSRKIWADGLVGGCGGLAIGLLCVALNRRCAGWAAAAGVSLGLAAMAKLPGLGLIPPAVLLILLAPGVETGKRWRMLLGLLLACGLVVTPWFAVFRQEYGVFTPDWIRPGTVLPAVSPMVARGMLAPWHYYLTESILIAPVVLVTLLAALVQLRRFPTPYLLGALAWVILPWLLLLFLRIQGHSQQLRFLTVAVPGFYVLLNVVLARSHPRRSLLPLLVLVTVLYGAISGGFYLLDDRSDEIVPVPEMLWRSIEGPPKT
ncbi:MAG TPA: hypothetical protein VMV94_09850 [Phycisphaerae bacterium]|nr:hypothetical protein [Phycisphaerae bacterium]